MFLKISKIKKWKNWGSQSLRYLPQIAQQFHVRNRLSMEWPSCCPPKPCALPWIPCTVVAHSSRWLAAEVLWIPNSRALCLCSPPWWTVTTSPSSVSFLWLPWWCSYGFSSDVVIMSSANCSSTCSLVEATLWAQGSTPCSLSTVPTEWLCVFSLAPWPLGKGLSPWHLMSPPSWALLSPLQLLDGIPTWHRHHLTPSVSPI